MSESRTATVVIATKNRKSDLRRALISSLRQRPAIEVLVMNDGSNDGTEEMVRAEFPSVVLHSFTESKGCIVRRNQGARLANGEIIFSIDDDAEFSAPDVIERTLCEFDHPRVADPRIGAVAIPYIEPRKSNTVMQRSPSPNGVWISERYMGTAHAVRRDLFLQLGAYREDLVHQGEESDFCIRLMDAGYFIRLGSAPPIIHHESPKRDVSRMDYYGSRNSVLFAWQNTPLLYLPAHLIATTIRCISWTFDPKRLKVRILGLVHGWVALPSTPRMPVRTKTYRTFRFLRNGGPVEVSSL